MVGTEADWSVRGEYIGKHSVTAAMANDALADPERLVIDPDPSSQSGQTIRVIGYSAARGRILTVIVHSMGARCGV